jgi:hypothetical protein
VHDGQTRCSPRCACLNGHAKLTVVPLRSAQLNQL